MTSEHTPEPIEGSQETESVGWASLPLFDGMSDAAFAHFYDAMEAVSYGEGDDIIVQGDEGDDMYVLEDGTIRVTLCTDGVTVFERTIGVARRARL